MFGQTLIIRHFGGFSTKYIDALTLSNYLVILDEVIAGSLFRNVIKFVSIYNHFHHQYVWLLFSLYPSQHWVSSIFYNLFAGC